MPSRTVGVENGRLFHDGELRERDLIADAETGRVLELSSDVDDLRGREHTTVDADGALVLPGGVDAHVHFREPGASHKEDWRTGSRSAAAGGVTAVVDQPNTSPPTVDARSFEEKRELASKSLVDYGINAGVTPDWKPDELAELPVTAYGEVFMADSTGEMGIRTDLFSEALETLSGREALVTVHAEDSSEFVDVDGDDPDAWSRHRPPQSESKAVETAVEVADRHDARLHFAHVSHPDSVELIHATRHTCEVTPHHLFLSRDDLDELGTHGRMNPPLRTEEARRSLWEMTKEGMVDIVATDHAPHTLEEKDTNVWDAPSGVPGVETMLPLLLARYRRGEMELDRIVELVSEKPADVFGFGSKGGIEVGSHADVVVVADSAEYIEPEALHSKCRWTPFEGHEAVFPEKVLRRGELVYDRTDDAERFADGGGRLLS